MHKSYSYFKDRSLKTPPYKYIFGHYLNIWSNPSISRQYEEWTKEYGSIYGLYEGTRPVYVVSDVDFLEQIFINQFSNFHSRRVPFTSRLSNGNYVHLFGADGDRWRRQRHIINPTFSNRKLKFMMNLLENSIEKFLIKIEKENEKEIDLMPYYKKLTFDIICQCAFGIDSDAQNNTSDEMLLKLTNFFKNNPEKILLLRLSYLIPSLIPFLTLFIRIQMKFFEVLRKFLPQMFNNVEEFPGFSIINQVKHVVNQRIKENTSRIDLLQLMINKSTSKQIDIDANSTNEYIHYDEIASNVFLFMLVGHDSLSITLTNATYILATHETIQNRLRTEIDLFFSEHQSFDYEQINHIQYLDLFCKEILRIYPIAIQAMSREASHDTSIKNYQIHKGDVIQVDVYSIHFSKELWGPEDPYEFLPERHLKRRHSMAFMAFGQGPRNCIGLRFALMEFKLTLVYLIKNYRILSTNKTKTNYSIKETLVIGPENLFIQLKKRSNLLDFNKMFLYP